MHWQSFKFSKRWYIFCNYNYNKWTVFSTEVNERYCNPHLNSGNIQFPLHLTSPLVVKSIIYYQIIIASPSLPTIYRPSWRQYYSRSLHWLTETISCGKLLDKISVKWNYLRGTIFYLNIYCWQSVAGKSDMEEGLSVPVIRPENLIYFPFILTVSGILYIRKVWEEVATHETISTYILYLWVRLS